MTRNEFIKQTNDGSLLNTYLFLGEEHLFHQELINLALNKLLTPEEREFNYMKVDAAATNPNELLTNLETPSFFGGVRVIYLFDFESGVSGIEEAVLKGSSNLADGVYLFISALKLDGRKKANQELQKKINVVDCAKINNNDLPVWLKQRSEKMGLTLTPGQIRVIAQRLGSDLLRARNELEKLKTYLGGKSAISDQELDLLIPGEPEPDIFALIDAVADRNPKNCIPRLEELLNSGENELKILATLSRQFRNITAAFEARRQGLTSRELAGLLGINPYVAEKSFLQSGRFSLEELHKVLERLTWADYRMKTGQREPRLELELAVVEICTLG